MHISWVRVKHFRSVKDMELDLGRLNVLCGPNSCGKSNVLKAIFFAFKRKRDITPSEVYGNLTSQVRDQHGPAASWVYASLEDCPKVVTDLVGARPGSKLEYFIKARREGTIERKLDGKSLSETNFDVLSEHFTVTYVPPVRDFEVGGLEPFRKLLADALKRGRGARSEKALAQSISKQLEDRAGALLTSQSEDMAALIGASRLRPAIESLDMEGLYRSVNIAATIGGGAVRLEELGTGHQSIAVMGLFRQLGEASHGDALYLFEEPDNHLHPSTIRAVGSLLETISKTSQVIATTHSPVLLNRVGFGVIRGLTMDSSRCTRKRNIALGGYSNKKLREILAPYNIRASEALLAQCVLVVEGQNDAAIISKLLEMKGISPDYAELIVIPAGGKVKVVEICELLHAMDVSWKAVFDWDAVQSPEVPYTRVGLTPAEATAARGAIGLLKGVLDVNSKRGRGVVKNLDALDLELQQGQPAVRLYDGSAAERLVKSVGLLTPSEQGELKLRLAAAQVRKYRALLEKTRIWLWPREIEDVLLDGALSMNIVEDRLRAHGLLRTSPAPSDRLAALRNQLKDIAAVPAALADIIETLGRANRFKYSAASSAVRYICSDIG